jgi:hypothetical protein
MICSDIYGVSYGYDILLEVKYPMIIKTILSLLCGVHSLLKESHGQYLLHARIWKFYTWCLSFISQSYFEDNLTIWVYCGKKLGPREIKTCDGPHCGGCSVLLLKILSCYLHQHCGWLPIQAMYCLAIHTEQSCEPEYAPVFIPGLFPFRWWLTYEQLSFLCF